MAQNANGPAINGAVEEVTGNKTPDLNSSPSHPLQIISLLAERWPQCFTLNEKRRRPLKRGIYLEALAQLYGAVKPQDLAAALRAYTENHFYLQKLSNAGATRLVLMATLQAPYPQNMQLTPRCN